MRQFIFLAVALLPLLATGCDPGVYRLEGRVSVKSDTVVLLHARVDTVADSLRVAYARSLDALLQQRRAREDSLQSLGDMGQAELVLARKELEAAQQRYRTVFGGLDRFHSFGGNTIFSNDDVDVACDVLIREIADRFYRGKAFSLETETEVRHFIRDRLIPEERRVRHRRAAVARLRQKNTRNAQAAEELNKWYLAEMASLVKRTNQGLKEALVVGELGRTGTDDDGWYEFQRVLPGRYTLYTVGSSSETWLQPVALVGHTRQDLADANRRELWVVSSGPGE